MLDAFDAYVLVSIWLFNAGFFTLIYDNVPIAMVMATIVLSVVLFAIFLY